MAKPIVVMYIPDHYRESGWEPGLVMNVLNGTQVVDGESQVGRTDYWTEYYWLVFTKCDLDAPELQVLYEKDFTLIKFDELRKFIEDSIKQNQEKE